MSIQKKNICKRTKEEILLCICLIELPLIHNYQKGLTVYQKWQTTLWWAWNSEYLRLFKEIDIDLWETIGKNPVKFLKQVSQEKLEQAYK